MSPAARFIKALKFPTLFVSGLCIGQTIIEIGAHKSEPTAAGFAIGAFAFLALRYAMARAYPDSTP